jgi:hypothetical protein
VLSVILIADQTNDYAIYSKWYFTGEIVQDTTTYTGTYFQVNDSIRLVTVKNFDSPACYVYVKDSVFKRTEIRQYWDILPNKYLMVRQLQVDYEKQFNDDRKYKF